MKKIIIVIAILFSLVSNGQVVPPQGYTGINFRYNWLAGKFEALHLPGFNTTPSLRSGQFNGAAAIGVDTVLHRVWFYSGGIWRRLASFTEIGVNAYVDTVYNRNDTLFYRKNGNEYFVSSFSSTPSASLQIDTTYHKLGTVIDSFNAILKSFRIIQNSVELEPDTTDNTISYDIGSSGGGGVNIYNADSLLAGDRIVGLNDKKIQFNQGSNPLLYISPLDSSYIFGDILGPTGSSFITIDNTSSTKTIEITAGELVRINRSDSGASSEFNWHGTILGGSNQWSINQFSTTRDVGPSDNIIYYDSGSPFTVTLPDVSVWSGRMLTIKNINTGTITVSGGGANIDGSATYSLNAQYKYVTVVSNGTLWMIVANN